MDLKRVERKEYGSTQSTRCRAIYLIGLLNMLNHYAVCRHIPVFIASIFDISISVDVGLLYWSSSPSRRTWVQIQSLAMSHVDVMTRAY